MWLYGLIHDPSRARRIMDEVTDGVLLDVRDADITDLLAESVKGHISTALDEVLSSGADSWNGFSNSI
jgi:hypothetical protein